MLLFITYLANHNGILHMSGIVGTCAKCHCDFDRISFEFGRNTVEVSGVGMGVGVVGGRVGVGGGAPGEAVMKTILEITFLHFFFYIFTIFFLF